MVVCGAVVFITKSMVVCGAVVLITKSMVVCGAVVFSRRRSTLRSRISSSQL
jgi:hypothetical protein